MTKKTKAVKTKATKPNKKTTKKPARKVTSALAVREDPVEAGLTEVVGPAAQLLQQAQSFLITDAASAMQANEMLVQLKTVTGRVEAIRKALTKPLKDEAKRIEAQFRPSADALEKADLLLRSKMLAFRQQAEAEVTQKRKELIAKAEEAAASGDQNTALALSQEAMSQDAGLAKTAMAADGSVGVRMVWDFEVEDLAKIPPEYFVLDETRVRAAVRSGVRDIPGLRIFQKEQLAVSAA